MKRLLLVLLLGVGLTWSKDIARVQIVAVHSVTYEDQGTRATLDKGLLGAHSTTKQQESFNLDTVINGEHVLLACDDPKGCEAPALGTYDGELKRSKWIHLGFTLPVSQKQVTLVAGNVRETEKRAALCPKRHRSHKSTPLLEKTNR